ncbi:MAG: hypothetical protein Q4F49_02505 [Pseudoxanthomonas suwonensis]|nr:hypothetical protein [Pseudoxanthomonas suwonensis]
MKQALAIMGGWFIWMAGFLVLYAVHGLHCGARGFPADMVRPALFATYLAVALAQAGWWAWTRRVEASSGERHFVARLARLSALAALLAWLAAGAPVLFTSTCA